MDDLKQAIAEAEAHMAQFSIAPGAPVDGAVSMHQALNALTRAVKLLAAQEEARRKTKAFGKG